MATEEEATHSLVHRRLVDRGGQRSRSHPQPGYTWNSHITSSRVVDDNNNNNTQINNNSENNNNNNSECGCLVTGQSYPSQQQQQQQQRRRVTGLESLQRQGGHLQYGGPLHQGQRNILSGPSCFSTHLSINDEEAERSNPVPNCVHLYIPSCGSGRL